MAALLWDQTEKQVDDIFTLTLTINYSKEGHDRNGTSSTNHAPSQVSEKYTSQAMIWRRVGAINTLRRVKFTWFTISSIQNTNANSHKFCWAELDSHDDTCHKHCCLHNGIPWEGHWSFRFFQRTLTILQDIPIVKVAMSYDNSSTGETFILIINQELYLKTNYSTYAVESQPNTSPCHYCRWLFQSSIQGKMDSFNNMW